MIAQHQPVDVNQQRVRVMKARRSSTVACGHYVLAGEQIVRAGSRWTCLPCALAATRAEASGHADADTRRSHGLVNPPGPAA
jgi:hypothetical protein